MTGMALSLTFRTDSPTYPYGKVTPTLNPKGLSGDAVAALDSLSFRHAFDRDAFLRLMDEVRAMPVKEWQHGVWMSGSWKHTAPFHWAHLVEIMATILDAIPEDAFTRTPVTMTEGMWRGQPVPDPFWQLAQHLRHDLRAVLACYLALNSQDRHTDSGSMKMVLTYLHPEGLAWEEVKHLAEPLCGDTRHIVWVEKKEIGWAI